MGKDCQKESVCSFRMNSLAGPVHLIRDFDSNRFPASLSAIT